MAGDRFRVRPNWIIWFAIVLHTTWGCLLLASTKPYGATALHVFGDVPRVLMAVLLFLASGLAAWAVTRRQPSLRSLVALLPQQAILTLSAYAAVLAVIEAHYPDGVIRPRGFILADQAPAIIVLILHTAAGREMRRSRTPSRCSSRLSAMCDQAPWFAGSSCTQTKSSAFGYRASAARVSSIGSG